MAAPYDGVAPATRSSKLLADAVPSRRDRLRSTADFVRRRYARYAGQAVPGHPRSGNERIALLSRIVRDRFKSEGGGERMRQYELMVILDPDLEERTVAPSLDQFLTVIRKDGGTVDKVDIWGRRRLAHEIAKKSDGIYAVIEMQAEPDTVKELDRQLNLTEAVLRTKVVRRDGK
jgi:small subunit ribosomal protein S6